jgi:hypothetical protein
VPDKEGSGETTGEGRPDEADLMLDGELEGSHELRLALLRLGLLGSERASELIFSLMSLKLGSVGRVKSGASGFV